MEMEKITQREIGLSLSLCLRALGEADGPCAIIQLHVNKLVLRASGWVRELIDS